MERERKMSTKIDNEHKNEEDAVTVAEVDNSAITTTEQDMIIVNDDGEQVEQQQQHLDDTHNTENKLQVQIHKFTDRVRAFSNDLMRSIERAHDIADLHNSKFAHATVRLAAANTESMNEDEETVMNSENDNQDNQTLLTTTKLDPVNVSRAPSNNNLDKISLDSVNTKNEVDEQQQQQPAINYEKLINNKNSLKVLIDKSKTPSMSYLENLGEPTATTAVAMNHHHQKEKNYDELTQSSIYLSTSSISEPYSHLNQVDFRVKPNIKRTDSYTTIPDGIYISIWEVFIYLWGVIAFFIDIISDIILSIGYFNGNKEWLGALTLLFVIVPNVTLSLFSLSWYIDNYYTFKSYKKGKKNGDEGDIGNQSSNRRRRSNLDDSFEINNLKKPNDKKSTFDSITFWITTIIFLILQLDLVYKYLQGFFYTLKGWIHKTFSKNDTWSKYYIEKQIKCDVDIGMLRLIDVFMDSGPQVLLQLYVITTQKLSMDTEGGPPAGTLDSINIAQLSVHSASDILKRENRLVLMQVVSISSSLFSMAYALAGYHRCLRNQQYLFCVNKSKRLIKPISWFSTIMQFLWYLFLISPRVLSMALFASTFRSWFFMIIFIHWLIMYFWILNLKTNYCITSSNIYNAREEIFEKFYNFVCSFIYIFSYFNLKSGKTRYRYLTYYIIFYLENILFSISYYCFSNEKNTFFKVSMLCIILVGFWLAILFQIVYYLYFHPAQDIRLCVKKKGKVKLIHVNSLRNKKLNKINGNRDNSCAARYRGNSKSTLDYSIHGSLELPTRNQDTRKSQTRSVIEQQPTAVEVPKILVTDNSALTSASTATTVDNGNKFEYKLFHLNDNLISSTATTSDDSDVESEVARSFKSVNKSKSSSIASIVSNESSYHSINGKQQQHQHKRNYSSSISYCSVKTLKDEPQAQSDYYSYNPLFLSYDLNSFVNNQDNSSSSTSSSETLSLKQQIELLKTKETSL